MPDKKWYQLGTDRDFENGLVCYPMNCLYQAVHNQSLYAKKVELSIVLGAFGISEDKYESKVHWVWAPEGMPRHCRDIHVWLEDGKGNVYDIVTPCVIAWCDEKQLRIPDYHEYEIIEAVSKSELEKKRMIYKPFKQFTLQENDSTWAIRVLDHDYVIPKTYRSEIAFPKCTDYKCSTFFL